LTVLGNGNVGIGITTPSERLYVIGSAIITQAAGAAGRVLTLGNDLSIYDIDGANTLELRGANASAEAGLTFGQSGATVYGKGGNIGIGTTNPGSKLEVNGTISGSIAANFSSITASQTDLGVSSSTGNWMWSSYVSCPAGQTLIMKAMITCTGSGSVPYEYCTCDSSGNQIRAGYLSYGTSANTNFMTVCQGLCVK
jgi:hypothetical protein